MSEFFNRTRGRNRSASITRRRCGWEKRNGAIVPMDELVTETGETWGSHAQLTRNLPWVDFRNIGKPLQEKETFMKSLYYLPVQDEKKLWETTGSKDDDEEDDTIPKTYRTCSVCLEVMNDKNVCVQIPTCEHIYHKDCIFSWSNHRNTCPLCVRPLPVYQKVHPQRIRQNPILLEHVDIDDEDDDMPNLNTLSLVSVQEEDECDHELEFFDSYTVADDVFQSHVPIDQDEQEDENNEPSEMAIDIVRHRTATLDKQLAIHALKLFQNDITQATAYIHEMEIAIEKTRTKLQDI